MQARLGRPVVLDAELVPAHWYVLESAARQQEGAREKSTSLVWTIVYRLTKAYFDDNSLEMGGSASRPTARRRCRTESRWQPRTFLPVSHTLRTPPPPLLSTRLNHGQMCCC